MKKNTYSTLQFLFWLVSGAETHILKQCRNDYSRFASIGFVLVMTTVFATISGFSAGHFFSHGNFAISLAFGVLWAMLIYSIDRSMVVSLKKKAETDDLPFFGKLKFYAIPFLSRALVGMMIGFFMSIPIEIIVFQDNITVQMDAENKQHMLDETNYINKVTNKQDKVNAKNDALRQIATIDSLLGSECPLPAYRSNKDLYDQAIPVKQNLYSRYLNARAAQAATPRRILNAQMQSVSNPRYVAARTRTAAALSAYNVQSRQCDDYQNQYRRADSTWRAEKNAERSVQDSTANANSEAIQHIVKHADTAVHQKQRQLQLLNGFTRQYEALNHAADARGSSSLLFLLWLIRLIFIGIEILPMLTKIMTPVGDYDRALIAGEKAFELELAGDLDAKEIAERLRMESESEIIAETENHRKGKEIELNKSLIDEAARVQMAVALAYLNQWEFKEMDEMPKRIEEFLKH
ncbi:uncharacterized protein DUF4407 [Mucilaginibacter oryzae]|uniref:Uncharacterized protein DUF4407 n=1 Tax=Mucilaginibacter oryzae TaxID=468058 RepID=A0A316GUL2_9SPHI|nr:DUF4407 domain-containing protein [Mucilaginibacter oryzae]PWK65780.1 uncharacterized protein DUF4407 [Mucilaginibacter oryzae]